VESAIGGTGIDDEFTGCSDCCVSYGSPLAFEVGWICFANDIPEVLACCWNSLE
jgi:hypothetical protein